MMTNVLKAKINANFPPMGRFEHNSFPEFLAFYGNTKIHL